jgi:predicted nucleic acid-binding protein
LIGPYVFDTSVFIRTIRGNITPDLIARPLAAGRAYLSSVVACELWAGTKSREDAADLEMLVRGFERVGAILTPTHDDWAAAGRMLARYQRLHGSLASRGHSHDILVVLCAARVDGVVVTGNPSHIERWAGLARRAGRRVTMESVL